MDTNSQNPGDVKKARSASGEDVLPTGPGVTETGVIDTPNGRAILWHAPLEEALGDHLEEYLGPCTTVIHSPVLGLHIYVFPPCDARPDAWVLCTMGLSGFLMPGPATLPQDEWDAFVPMRRAELFMYVDSSIPILDGNLENQWPMKILQDIASYVVSQNKWVGRCDGLPNFQGMYVPWVADSTLCHCLISDECVEEREFYEFSAPNPYKDGEVLTVQLLNVVGLTEMEAKVKAAKRYRAVAPYIEWGHDIDLIWRTTREECKKLQ